MVVLEWRDVPTRRSTMTHCLGLHSKHAQWTPFDEWTPFSYQVETEIRVSWPADLLSVQLASMKPIQ